jgi:hypothetical protein
MKRPFRHLKRRRVLIWVLALVLIAGFGTAIGGIFWSVRMKTEYRADITPAGEEIFLAPVSRLPLQAFRTGDPAVLKLSTGEELPGVLRAFSPGPERVELRLEFPGLPAAPAEGEITIRSQRLFAAFLSSIPAR